MAIIDVIKYEGGNGVLVWKHPKEDFNTSAQLIVAEPWQAIVYANGSISQPYRNGKYTLETGNIPFVRKVVELVTGGVSPNHYEVFFINPEFAMPVKWGTESAWLIKDPVWELPVHVQAFGQYRVRISDAKKMMTRLVGKMTRLDEITLKQNFGGDITKAITEEISSLIKEEKIDYAGFGTKLSDTARKVEPKIAGRLMEYGLLIESFSIESIQIVDDKNLEAVKAEEKRIRDGEKRIGDSRLDADVRAIETESEAASQVIMAKAKKEETILHGEGDAAAREAQGYSIQEEWEHEEEMERAKNATGIMGAQYVGANRGPIKNARRIKPFDDRESIKPPILTQQIICKECGAALEAGEKFCGECGAEVATQESDLVQCLVCGSRVRKKKFCSQCKAPLAEE